MQQRAQQTRQRILQAALAEFAANGLNGARVDAIARRSAANKERIYAYFGSKERLFRDVLQFGVGQLLGEERRLLTQLGNDPTRLTEVVLDHYLRFHESHPHFWRLLTWENLHGGRHARVLRGMRQDTFRRLRALYGRGQRQGRFAPGVSFETFIFALSAVTFFYFSNQLTMQQTLALDLARPAVRRRITREILKLFNHDRH